METADDHVCSLKHPGRAELDPQRGAKGAQRRQGVSNGDSCDCGGAWLPLIEIERIRGPEGIYRLVNQSEPPRRTRIRAKIVCAKRSILAGFQETPLRVHPISP